MRCLPVQTEYDAIAYLGVQFVASYLFAILPVAIALVTDTPSINAAIPYVPPTIASKTRPSDFVHPGLWHSHEDLELIRTSVLSKRDPWYSAYELFANDTYSVSTYQMQGPKPVLSRGAISNYTTFTADSRAAYQNAIMWYITKDDGHYKVATSILDGWGSNLTNIIGTDRSLLIGIEGDMFVNAAEIMRWEAGWVEAGAKWQGTAGFSIQLYSLFARQSLVIGQANYGIASIKALMNFAVYLEDVSMYNFAVWSWLSDPCAGIEATIDSSTGQNSESGRDQGHCMSGLGWLMLGARTAKNQGVDLYRYAGDLLLKGIEYVAKYSLGNNVTYDPNFRRCEAVLVNGPWPTISEYNRFVVNTTASPVKKSPNVWDLFYYTAKSHALSAPWTTKAKALNDKYGGEAVYSASELVGWGDLLWAN
ncbi:chondroitin AC/alginate lyase [Xylariaceae sp. FL1272]|nr:chondroitin AC/alginate lyase [Xylariaceae sp. FL1272]